jgi:hypothetical protein
MAGLRRNVVLTDANYQWAAQQAPHERALSQFINNLLQRERVLGPIERRMEQQVAALDVILTRRQGGEESKGSILPE